MLPLLMGRFLLLLLFGVLEDVVVWEDEERRDIVDVCCIGRTVGVCGWLLYVLVGLADLFVCLLFGSNCLVFQKLQEFQKKVEVNLDRRIIFFFF